MGALGGRQLSTGKGDFASKIAERRKEADTYYTVERRGF